MYGYVEYKHLQFGNRDRGGNTLNIQTHLLRSSR